MVNSYVKIRLVPTNTNPNDQGRRSGLEAILVYALISCTWLTGCQGDHPPDRQILVKNDSHDSSYNIITVSGGGAYGALRPGEKLILPAGTKSFSVERRYKDYTRSYSVSCPELTGRGIVVKLIDIHVNRIAGGCKTIHAAKD
jgi:hypothetical protein